MLGAREATRDGGSLAAYTAGESMFIPMGCAISAFFPASTATSELVGAKKQVVTLEAQIQRADDEAEVVGVPCRRSPSRSGRMQRANGVLEMALEQEREAAGMLRHNSNRFGSRHLIFGCAAVTSGVTALVEARSSEPRQRCATEPHPH